MRDGGSCKEDDMASTKRDDKLRELEELGLFARCTKREIEAVAHLCISLPIQEGYVLTTEGGVGQQCFVVAEGTARVSRAGYVVGHVGPGDLVGEVALLDGGRRTATVTAETPMTVYVLSMAEFWSMLAASSNIAAKVAVTLARRLRTAETDALRPLAVDGVA
jgi:CRP/FNR family transcriptional regulator, cyclic AMP receptor protein